MIEGPTLTPYAAPGCDTTRSERPPRAELRFDTVRITAWTYAVYLGAVVPLSAAGSLESEPPLSPVWPVFVLMFPFTWATWAATRRFRVGYCACFAISLLMLFSPPIGTVIGFNMLRALRQNRNVFFCRAARRE
jgi:hypothetical protein